MLPQTAHCLHVLAKLVSVYYGKISCLAELFDAACQGVIQSLKIITSTLVLFLKKLSLKLPKADSEYKSARIHFACINGVT